MSSAPVGCATPPVVLLRRSDKEGLVYRLSMYNTCPLSRTGAMGVLITAPDNRKLVSSAISVADPIYSTMFCTKPVLQQQRGITLSPNLWHLEEIYQFIQYCYAITLGYHLWLISGRDKTRHWLSLKTIKDDRYPLHFVRVLLILLGHQQCAACTTCCWSYLLT